MQQNEDCAIVSRQNGESSAYERLLGMKRPSSSAMANLVEPQVEAQSPIVQDDIEVIEGQLKRPKLSNNEAEMAMRARPGMIDLDYQGSDDQMKSQYGNNQAAIDDALTKLAAGLKQGQTELQYQYQPNNERNAVVIDAELQQKQTKRKKKVQWAEPKQLEDIKYFKMNDAPNAPGLSQKEVFEIQKHLADVPAHMIPSELQKIEMMMDRKIIEKQKQKQRADGLLVDDKPDICEVQLRGKLREMRPLIRFTRKLIKMDQGDFNMQRGGESTETQVQITREADKFRYYAADGQVPPDPRSEMDEHYSKDEKVPQIDLEVFANAHIQKLEEKQFQQDMLKLQAEVDFLEEDQKHKIMELLSANQDVEHKQLHLMARKEVEEFKRQNEIKKAQQLLAQAQQQQGLTDHQRGPHSAPHQNAHPVQGSIPQQAQAVDNNPNQLIKPSNYRTVPCRNFHGPTGCTRGDFCHFIHASGYDGVELPRDVFQSYRNENMKTNFLTELKKILPQDAANLESQTLPIIQQFINQHNAKITGENPLVAMTQIGQPHPQMAGQQMGMNPLAAFQNLAGANPQMQQAIALQNQSQQMAQMGLGGMRPGMNPQVAGIRPQGGIPNQQNNPMLQGAMQNPGQLLALQQLLQNQMAQGGNQQQQLLQQTLMQNPAYLQQVLLSQQNAVKLRQQQQQQAQGLMQQFGNQPQNPGVQNLLNPGFQNMGQNNNLGGTQVVPGQQNFQHVQQQQQLQQQQSSNQQQHPGPQAPPQR